MNFTKLLISINVKIVKCLNEIESYRPEDHLENEILEEIHLQLEAISIRINDES